MFFLLILIRYQNKKALTAQQWAYFRCWNLYERARRRRQYTEKLFLVTVICIIPREPVRRHLQGSNCPSMYFGIQVIKPKCFVRCRERQNLRQISQSLIVFFLKKLFSYYFIAICLFKKKRNKRFRIWRISRLSHCFKNLIKSFSAHE